MLDNRFSKFRNKGWSKNSIYFLLKGENPESDEEYLLQKTIQIYKELNKLNQQTRRSDHNFYAYHILLSDMTILQERKIYPDNSLRFLKSTS